MTKQIKFFDTTLRDGEQTIGVNFSVEQKVEIAKALEAWGVDYIEAGFPIASPEDFRAVNAIAKTIKHTTVTGLARLVRKDMDAVRDAIAPAPHQMLHTFIATSPIHREYKLHMTKAEMIAKIRSDVAYGKSMFDVVEFSPEDASRTEPDFLVEAVQAAIDAGATMINIPDTVGYDDPEEFGAIFANLKAHIVNFDQIEWAAHTHNDLGMAMANAMAAIKNGATQVQGTINGLGDRAGNVDEIKSQLPFTCAEISMMPKPTSTCQKPSASQKSLPKLQALPLALTAQSLAPMPSLMNPGSIKTAC